MNNHETILYFADADLSNTGSGAYKASRFMGLDQTGATGADFYFKNEDFENAEEEKVLDEEEEEHFVLKKEEEALLLSSKSTPAVVKPEGILASFFFGIVVVFFGSMEIHARGICETACSFR